MQLLSNRSSITASAEVFDEMPSWIRGKSFIATLFWGDSLTYLWLLKCQMWLADPDL